MIQIVISIAIGLLSAINLVLLVQVLKRLTLMERDEAEDVVQNELRSLREEVSRSEREVKEEVRASQRTTTDTLVRNIEAFGNILTTQVEGMRTTVEDRFQNLQQSIETRLASGTKAINDLTQSNETSIENVRKTVDERLQTMQASNENKLDQMRKTVDEQLQSTLEKRLGESFSIVSKNLEVVQRGLGEMQNLATGVGDLKRVLTFKARGTWGEVQLGSLLEEVLTPDQYSKNVQVRENSRERVEYAIRLPGSNDGPIRVYG